MIDDYFFLLFLIFIILIYLINIVGGLIVKFFIDLGVNCSIILFLFNSIWRFRSNIIYYLINFFNFIYNVVRNSF